MRWVSRHPGLASFLVGCAVLALVEVACIYRAFRDARTSSGHLRKSRAELRVLAQVRPALTSEETARLQTDLAAAIESAKRLRAELSAAGDGPTALQSLSPAERADGYFDIASFVERMRETAERRGVIVDQQERFGFSEFAHKGPEVADLPRVFRERCATEYLLRQLFEAQPHQLLAVQRERRPATKASLNGAAAERGFSGSDYFEWDQKSSVRLPDIVDTFAIRVSFVGQTLSLRLLLNQLAAFELPFLVRTVEVAPAEPAKLSSSLTEDKPVRDAPLVARSLSRFTVTVELVELVEFPGAGS